MDQEDHEPDEEDDAKLRFCGPSAPDVTPDLTTAVGASASQCQSVDALLRPA